MSTVLRDPWQHAITDIGGTKIANVYDQLKRTDFSAKRFPPRDAIDGIKQVFQYHMDGARNRLPLDDGNYDLAEILDYNLMIELWDTVRDPIYDVYSKMVIDRRPFSSISIEYTRCYSGDIEPISRKDANRMNNLIMLDITNGVTASVKDGFGIYRSPEDHSHFVKWKMGMMLSYVPTYGKTWVKYPIEDRSYYRYINIALRS